MLHKLLKNKTDNIFIQLFRYAIVGGSSFIIDFGLLYLLTEYGHLYYLLSATISFLAGLIVNYLLSITWVFTENVLQNRFWEFLFFALIGCIGLLINLGFLYFFTEICHAHYLLSKILATLFTLFWNFFARKYALFNNYKKSDKRHER